MEETKTAREKKKQELKKDLRKDEKKGKGDNKMV